MRIKIFYKQDEYINHNDHKNYDIYVCYFAITKQPNHSVPIIRLIKSEKDGMNRGFSSFAATNGFSVENFPRCDDHEIEDFAKKFLEGKLDKLSIPQKFRNFATAVFKHVSNNMENVPPYILQARLTVCSTCPFLVDRTCNLCGCPVDTKAKWATESCPDDPKRWGEFVKITNKSVTQEIFDSSIRNIIFYAWCIDDEIINYHLSYLSKYMHLFNGRKIATLIDANQYTINKFEALGFFVITGKNIDSEYPGESFYFHAMLSQLPKDNSITFYGHAKGVTYGATTFKSGPVKPWVDYLYGQNLGRAQDMFNLLRSHTFAGANIRTVKKTLPEKGFRKIFVYPGTFFWFKNSEVFKLDWQYLHKFYGAVEDWPGIITGNKIGALDMNNMSNDITDMYNINYWAKPKTECVPCSKKK